MRILIVSQYFWPESFRVNDLAAVLKDRGHEVSVLTGMPNYPSGQLFPGYRRWLVKKEGYHGIPIYRVPLIPRGKGRSWRLALNFLSFAVTASLLGPLLCRGKYDVIFTYEPSPFTVGFPAMVLRRLKSAPMLLWVQDLWPESLAATGAIRSPRLLRLVARMVRAIYRRCDRVLIQSQGFRQPAIASGAKVASIRYFPNWAEDLYRPVTVAADAAERKEMPEGFCVLFAGNLGMAQSLDTIIGAAQYLRGYHDIRWVFLGDGRQQEWLCEQVAKLNLADNIHILGRRPVETMPAYFSLADALLVTLRRDPVFALTVPSKVQSYLACGRPIIAALDGEGSKIIKASGAGLAVPAQDSRALAEAVMSLYRLPKSERAEMGKKGRAYFEKHFEREHLLDRLEAWMLETVQEWPCAS